MRVVDENVRSPLMQSSGLIRFCAIACALVLWTPPAFADDVASRPASPVAVLAIGGEVATPLRLDAAAVQRLPHRALDASEHGKAAHWDGVALADLLRAAGAPLGEALRGRNLALYVRVTAADGYRAVYSLAELDPAMHDGEVILADRRDGHALDAKEGPYRLVAKDDKRPVRWVRQVIAIDLLGAPAP
jgi:DMSO/TMAO reductase YedYZ molybdopterin-dependent catalytic subunit